MKCPSCGCQEDKVIDSRTSKEGASVRRRRECIECQYRFTTLEEVVPAEMSVIKRDGNREEFDAQKIRDGMNKACWKRPVRETQIDKLTDDVLKQIEQSGEREIESERIGEIVMVKLQDIDEVAYVRFASVYRKFKDIDQFIDEIKGLSKKKS
jgi:transcriptional repressor NrdR